jgi:hypothetical protein
MFLQVTRLREEQEKEVRANKDKSIADPKGVPAEVSSDTRAGRLTRLVTVTLCDGCLAHTHRGLAEYLRRERVSLQTVARRCSHVTGLNTSSAYDRGRVFV